MRSTVPVGGGRSPLALADMKRFAFIGGLVIFSLGVLILVDLGRGDEPRSRLTVDFVGYEEQDGQQCASFDIRNGYSSSIFLQFAVEEQGKTDWPTYVYGKALPHHAARPVTSNLSLDSSSVEPQQTYRLAVIPPTDPGCAAWRVSVSFRRPMPTQGVRRYIDHLGIVLEKCNLGEYAYEWCLGGQLVFESTIPIAVFRSRLTNTLESNSP